MVNLILSLNVGSTSVKSKIFAIKGRDELKEVFSWSKSNLKESVKKEAVLRLLFAELEKNRLTDKIKGVAHRVVHGGEMSQSTLIDGKIISTLHRISHLAPLHNPFNLEGIVFARRTWPKAAHLAVFDTAFFAGLPEKTALYPISSAVSRRFGLKRYGFHGISHAGAAAMAKKTLGQAVKNQKIITVHLGGGASVAAVLNGCAIDTSMGFTPLEGLMMSTRAGDIDPGIIFYLMRRGMRPEKIEAMLLRESGFVGVAQCTNMLELIDKIKKKEPRAILAFEMFVYRIRKYIGAYWAALGGCDALVFTGSIGAGKAITRNEIVEPLMKTLLKNTKILVHPTSEEKTMAEEWIRGAAKAGWSF